MNPQPDKNGTYAAEVYFGWKILEWHDGQWWHTDKVSKWTASEPVQFVGPLPGLKGGARKTKPLYDL